MARKKPEVVREQVIGAPPRAAPARPFVALDEVLGQERVVQTLLTAASTGHLHHAWIFHGPPGVGKFTTAVAFAALALDPTTTADLSGRIAPDPDSQTQKLVRAGTHPDLHVITKELAAICSDDRVRNSKQTNVAKAVLEEFLVTPSQRARALSGDSFASKVFIVDEAELIAREGHGLLLKTLEEPPLGTVLILVTSHQDRLPPTIRSRCQRVAFSPLGDKDMRQWLKRTGHQVEKEQLDWVLTFACGSPGAAELAIENDLFQWHVALSPMFQQLARGEFPIEMGATMAQLITERADAAVKANPQASRDAVKRAWARRMLGHLAEQTRRSLHESVEPKASRVGGGAARALSGLDAIAEAEVQLATNVNLEMLLENVAARLAAEPQPV